MMFFLTLDQTPRDEWQMGCHPVGSRPLRLRASKVRCQNERPFLVALVSGLKFAKAHFANR
jgi:hypothetical protein